MRLMVLSVRSGAKEKNVSIAHDAKLELIARQKAALFASRATQELSPRRGKISSVPMSNQGGRVSLWIAKFHSELGGCIST